MGWHNYAGTGPVTVAASTGLRQFRGVTISSAGLAEYPNNSTVGQPIMGVIDSAGTTGSTDAAAGVGVQMYGVVEMEAEASSLVRAGKWVSCSSVGRAQSATNVGDSIIGLVVAGSSGAANRRVQVALIPLASSIAPTQVA